MTREIGDTSSACGTCMYWSHHPDADGIHSTRLGSCQWLSVPSWVWKHIKGGVMRDGMTKMREHEGKDCWLHIKRSAQTVLRSAGDKP